MELSLDVGADERRHVDSRIEGGAEAPECRVVVGQVPSPPFLERGELREPETSSVHRQRSDHSRGPAVAVPERVNGRQGGVDPGGADGRMLRFFLHGRARAVDEVGTASAGGG